MDKNVTKLLDEFAAGRLTEKGKRQLAASALANEDVFDALLDEHMIKHLIENQECRTLLASSRLTVGKQSAQPISERVRQSLGSLLDRIIPERGASLPSPDAALAYGITSLEHSTPVRGTIQAVSDHIVTVDIGADSGLTAGMHIEVRRPRIVDGKTSEEYIGVVVVGDVEAGQSTGRFTGTTTASVGDIVLALSPDV